MLIKEEVMAGIFTDSTVLDESPSSNDLLNYKTEIDRVGKHIRTTISNGKSVIIAYLGAFGIGKSTILQHAEAKLSQVSKWITFETWRYANRNELWDAFVIKLVSEIEDKPEIKVAKYIDGNRFKIRIAILWMLGILAASTLASWMLYPWLSANTGFWKAYFQYAVPVIIPMLLLVGLGRLLAVVPYSEPLRRVFQLENLLKDALSHIEVPLVVVIEDVDRANEDASIFMEALHEFIGKYDSQFNHPVIIIAPQSNNAFDALDMDRKKNIEHSLKVYDQKMYFSSAINDRATVEQFYSKIKFNKAYQKYKPTMIEVTWEINYYYRKDQLTIRMLKHALREVNWFIQAYPDHNPSVALVYALARMLKNDNNLPIRELHHSKNLTIQNRGGSSPKDFAIAAENVFAACQAIAAGADGSGEAAGFLDESGKFKKPSNYQHLEVQTEKNGEHIASDEVEDGGEHNDSYGSRKLKVYVRPTYREQLTI